MSSLTWVDDRAETEHGSYHLQVEHVRWEPPYWTLLYFPADPTGRSGFVDLGPAREENETDWDKAGKKAEVKALAREHHRKMTEKRAATRSNPS